MLRGNIKINPKITKGIRAIMDVTNSPITGILMNTRKNLKKEPDKNRGWFFSIEVPKVAIFAISSMAFARLSSSEEDKLSSCNSSECKFMFLFLKWCTTTVCEKTYCRLININKIWIAANAVWFLYKNDMQFITGQSRQQTYFSTLEDQVGSDNTVGL